MHSSMLQCCRLLSCSTLYSPGAVHSGLGVSRMHVGVWLRCSRCAVLDDTNGKAAEAGRGHGGTGDNSMDTAV